MKGYLIIPLLIFLFALNSQSSEIKEPIEFCYSGNDCAVFLLHHNTGEFIIDSEETFNAVREIKTSDFNFSIQRVTAEEKARQAAIARDTQRTIYITNKDLIALQRQGQKAVDAANTCAWALAECASASTLIAVGKETSKVILVIGLVGAVITCKTSGGDSCTEVSQSLDEFREDYKYYLLEHEKPFQSVGSQGDPHRPTPSSGAGFGTGGAITIGKPLPDVYFEYSEK